MKAILINLFIFLFVLGVAIWNFVSGRTIYGIITAVLCLVDLFILGGSIYNYDRN